MYHSLPPPPHKAVQRGPAPRWWRQCVAFLTALSFVLLLATSASHHHSALEAHDCAVCGAVLHQIAALPAAPPVIEISPILLYHMVSLASPRCVLYVTPLLLPPGCGPPSFLS